LHLIVQSEVYRWLLGQTPDIHCQGTHSGGTNAFKGNSTVLKNNTKVNSLLCTGVNKEVKAVHFINAIKIEVKFNLILRFNSYHPVSTLRVGYKNP
jgi:hypothetical protein